MARRKPLDLDRLLHLFTAHKQRGWYSNSQTNTQWDKMQFCGEFEKQNNRKLYVTKSSATTEDASESAYVSDPM